MTNNTQTFKQWVSEYDQDTLHDIATHGCSGGVAGMIYYQETGDLYDRHCVELHEVLENYKENFGEWPEYIINELGCATTFKNAVVWFVAEVYAQELVEA